MSANVYFIPLKNRYTLISNIIMKFAKEYAKDHNMYGIMYMSVGQCIGYSNRSDRDKVYAAIIKRFGPSKWT